MLPRLAAFKWERPAFQYSPERWHPVRAIGTENEVSKDSVSDDVVEEVASKEKLSEHQLRWHNDHLEALSADKEGTFYLWGSKCHSVPDEGEEKGKGTDDGGFIEKAQGATEDLIEKMGEGATEIGKEVPKIIDVAEKVGIEAWNEVLEVVDEVKKKGEESLNRTKPALKTNNETQSDPKTHRFRHYQFGWD